MRRLRTLAAPVLLTLIVGCGDDSPSGPGHAPQSRILFVSPRPTIQTEIWVMNADGTDQMRLTYNALYDGAPSWSPDASHIVFTRWWLDANQRVWSGIFRMNPDGSSEACLDSFPDTYCGPPRVSPDKSQIVFDQSGEVWIMNADGTQAHSLTTGSEQGSYPDWSPDGSRIVYSRQGPEGMRIYTMSPTGTDTVKVLETGVANSFQVQPRYSPDGTKIAYVDNRGIGGNPDMTWIYVMGADGSNPTPVTPLTDGLRDWPTWSPDGTRIAYRDNYRNGGADRDAEIYSIGIDGTGETNVSRYPAAHDISPDWGPEP